MMNTKRMRTVCGTVCGITLFCGVAAERASTAESTPATELQVVGDWQVKVTARLPGGKQAVVTETLAVPPATLVTVKGERYVSLPVYNGNGGGWNNGARLRGVKAQECSTAHLLEPGSFELRGSAEPDGVLFEMGKDYGLETAWATFGRLPEGRIKSDQAVYVSYRHGLLRIDSVVLTGDQRIALRQGEPNSAAPLPADLKEGDRRLANIWLPGRITKLTPDHLFPILEQAYPEPRAASPTPAERLLPRVMAKIRQGQPVRVLAWGDSVTDGGYLPDPRRERWQEQFAARLRPRFPAAPIELVTEAWGGRSTASYLAEPPGSPHNYKEKVLDAKPDLIVSEFVNDAGLNPEQVKERYGRLLADFKAIGAEWVILTPHYVRIDWMGLTRERDIDEDPRPYVKGLRQFASTNEVALADAALRYGRLWRQGIPFSSLMLNSINHPNAKGMSLFADSLMALFPAK